MTGQDLLGLAARNLREAALRNSLTIIGIGVGVASLVAMLSLGVGLQQLANRRLARSGLFDVVYVTSWRDARDFEAEGRAREGQGRILDDQARGELVRLPNVLEVEPEVLFMGEVRYGGGIFATFVAGLPPSARENESFEGMKGHFFSSSHAPEAILQGEFAKALGKGSADSVLNQEFVLRYAARQPLSGIGRAAVSSAASTSSSGDAPSGYSVIRQERKLKIVGIIEDEPFGGVRRVSRARVFIPTDLASDWNITQSSDLRGIGGESSGRSYSALVVQVSGPARIQAVQDAIRRMGFRTYSILDTTKGLRRFFAILDLFLGIFGSLALAVAFLAIVNTLVMAVMERRREIGIMKAIGASDADVKKLFFAEAGAMGFAGGILGIALGWSIGYLINFGTNLWLHRQRLPSETVWSSPLWLVFAALGFSVIVSLIAGLYPAARAARLDPVQALRYE